MCSASGESALIIEATSGDRAALERLLLDHYDRLAKHIGRKLVGPLVGLISADDILQETFIQAIGDIEQCEARTEQVFFAWLKSVADHRWQDITKGLNRKKRSGDHVQVRRPLGDLADSMVDLVELISDQGKSPSRRVARNEAVQAIRVGIAGLANDQREAICLHHIEGKSLEDTAAAMGRSPAAVRGLIHRAKRALRNTMERSSMWLSSK